MPNVKVTPLRTLKVTQPAISMAVRRGAELVKEENLSVEGLITY